MAIFDSVPNAVRQSFSRIRRTSSGAVDSYGDATFTENTTAGFRGFFQVANAAGERVILAGKELQYDAVIYTSGTMLLGEDDVLLFGSSTSTSVSTRYHVEGVRLVYDGLGPDHKQVFVRQEVV